MRLFSNSDFEALSWYRKITRVVLTPFVILLIAPAVLLIFGVIGVFAAVSNYLGETKKGGAFLAKTSFATSLKGAMEH